MFGADRLSVALINSHGKLPVSTDGGTRTQWHVDSGDLNITSIPHMRKS